MAVASKTWTTAYGRYVRLRITAQEVEVDTPNNRSKVRVTGQVYYEGGTTAHNAYPQTYTVTVNGTQIGRQTGFTYSLSSGKSKSLTTYTSGWINHNSNGAKSVTVRGHITDGAGDTGTINQTYALTTIARASTLSSFSMPNHLKPGTTTTFNLGISRKSSSFTHDISLRDGSTVIASWTGQATPTTRSLTATQTNTLLKRMSSSTSRTMTLRVQTKSGSTNIGGALTRTATVYVHSDVKPSVSALSVTIEGNAHAKNTVKRFVQNISKVSGKFTRSAKGGATISSSRLQIRRVSGGADLQTINTNSGTFPKVVALNGPYQARGIATDSRGRSNDTGWVNLSNFDVLAYSTPQITTFSTNRRTGTETTVDIVRNGTHSGLSGKNMLTIRLQKRASGTTTWSNVVNDVTTTNNTFGATVPSTGHSIDTSYDFKLYIADQFGNSAERISTVSTQRVVLDIHKNEGVGIGKIHEDGALDVGGDIRLAPRKDLGTTTIGPESQINFTRNEEIVRLFHRGADENFGIYIGTQSLARTRLRWNKSFWNFENINDTDVRINGRPIMELGSNSNGNWVRFYGGTQICWLRKDLTSSDMTSSRTDTRQGIIIYGIQHGWIFPKAFTQLPSVSVGGDEEGYGRLESITSWSTTNSRVQVGWESLLAKGSVAFRANYIAIGRWR